MSILFDSHQAPSAGATNAAPTALPRVVALAGNPNSGKTTLFNALTGLRHKVGNYPGVTVEKKTGVLTGIPAVAGTAAPQVEILDLPGTYSISPRSPDEKIVRDVLLGRVPGTPRPDVILCVVDASNLERNLFFVSQVMDMGLPVIVALNMMDLAVKRGIRIDVSALQKRLGTPVVPTIARKNEGIAALRAMLARSLLAPPGRHWRMPALLEEETAELAGVLVAAGTHPSVAFAEAIILLGRTSREQDTAITADAAILSHVEDDHRRLAAAGIDPRAAAIEARYAWIHDVCEETVIRPPEADHTDSDRIDAVLTHRVWGWVFFLGVMTTMFVAIFSLASIPMDLISGVFADMSNTIRHHLPTGLASSLLVDGVLAGVGSVVVFLPQILILFFFIGLLEDTGYMARAAFIIDRVMSRVGLHGKSFIPLLSSFACAIPGILATRTIENRKDRLVTILIAPLMSCSARLPVYTVMIATLLPGDTAPAWQKAGIMLSMYALGMAVAFTMAFLFKRTILKGETPALIMELPPYRRPSMRAVLIQMWERGLHFLKRAGTIILALSIILWVLVTFPNNGAPDSGERIRGSAAGQLGILMEPLIRPLGFDWRIGIGLVGSVAAREVFVSTMGVVFSVEDAADNAQPLTQAFRVAAWPDGRPLFTPLVCLSLMVFYVLAMQCLSTVVVVRRETGGWRWPLFQWAYMTGLAWIASFLLYQGGRLLGWS